MHFDQLKRREFITLFGGTAAWPLAARAERADKRPTIGLLGANSASAQRQTTDALVGRLRELGWSDGRNLTIEYRWADGRSDHLPGLAAELVARKVDVIVASGTPPVLAAQHATSTIPIVFVGIGDPVGTGLVKSLARPGGNATGLSPEDGTRASRLVLRGDSGFRRSRAPHDLLAQAAGRFGGVWRCPIRPGVWRRCRGSWPVDNIRPGKMQL
jgi:ABC transporter substrate binding protein